MGKGGKNNQQHPEPQDPIPQPQQNQQEGPSEQQEEGFDGELSDRDEELLQRIEEQIENSIDPLKLTWAAIHKLKEEQKDLNEEMDDQMREIQAKFDQIRKPLIAKLAKAASGYPLQKEIYTQHPMTQSICVNKNKPKGIPGFWKNVLITIAFCIGEQDDEILSYCTRLECEKIRKIEEEIVKQDIKVVFEFEENSIIENKSLMIELLRNGEELTVKQLTTVKFKGHIPESSTFNEIFNPQADLYRTYSICQDLQRAYNNSIFYYLYEGQKEDEQQVQNEEAESKQEIKESKSEKQKKQPEDSLQQDQKPIEKTVVKDPRHPVERPQCKNQ